MVICDTLNNNKTKTIKLTGAPVNGKTPLGWCRGLYVDDTHFYVGFTQLRTTKITENC